MQPTLYTAVITFADNQNLKNAIKQISEDLAVKPFSAIYFQEDKEMGLKMDFLQAILFVAHNCCWCQFMEVHCGLNMLIEEANISCVWLMTRWCKRCCRCCGLLTVICSPNPLCTNAALTTAAHACIVDDSDADEGEKVFIHAILF